MNSTNDKRAMFTATIKMSELVDMNPKLLGVLPRIGVGFGFGEDTVEEACRRNNVSIGTFLLICNVYSVDDYIPDESDLCKADLKAVVDYLHCSHSYYTDVAINDIAGKIEKAIEPCEDKSHKIIWQFFSEYKEELLKHFQYEEEKVFPYVNAILAHEKRDYTILQYEESHSNVEEKLGDLKNIIMKYLPRSCDSTAISALLMNLYALKEDLNKHTIIEDGVLVPIVNRLEHYARQ